MNYELGQISAKVYPSNEPSFIQSSIPEANQKLTCMEEGPREAEIDL